MIFYDKGEELPNTSRTRKLRCETWKLINPNNVIIHYPRSALNNNNIVVNTFVAGDYKSATEIFSESKMSEQDRQQSKIFLNDLFLLSTMIGKIELIYVA